METVNDATPRDVRAGKLRRSARFVAVVVTAAGLLTLWTDWRWISVAARVGAAAMTVAAAFAIWAAPRLVDVLASRAPETDGRLRSVTWPMLAALGFLAGLTVGIPTAGMLL